MVNPSPGCSKTGGRAPCPTRGLARSAADVGLYGWPSNRFNLKSIMLRCCRESGASLTQLTARTIFPPTLVALAPAGEADRTEQ